MARYIVAFLHGEEIHFHQDHLGSVLMLTDADGNVLQRYRYDIHGNATVLDAAGNVLGAPSLLFQSEISDHQSEMLPLSPYLFAGRRFDIESGLYYVRNRYYSPLLGKFISPDPLDYVDGMNVYAYVNGNVVNLVDPMGTDSLEVYSKVKTRRVAVEQKWPDENYADLSGYIPDGRDREPEYRTEILSSENRVGWIVRKWNFFRSKAAVIDLGRPEKGWPGGFAVGKSPYRFVVLSDRWRRESGRSVLLWSTLSASIRKVSRRLDLSRMEPYQRTEIIIRTLRETPEFREPTDWFGFEYNIGASVPGKAVSWGKTLIHSGQSGNWRTYEHTTALRKEVLDDPSRSPASRGGGLDLGASGSLVLARGYGSFAGDFRSVSFGVGFVGVGYFWSEDGVWSGFSLGLSWSPLRWTITDKTEGYALEDDNPPPPEDE